MTNNLFIAVEGADGTGKTTFINELEKAFHKIYSAKKNVKVYHFRPTILPNLGEVGEKAGLMKQDTDFTNPHRAKPAGFLNSLIRMSYYWIDYLIGIPVLLRKNKEGVVIFDRYIYDFLIDPHRSRINLPYWMRRVFTRMVIPPKIVFVLIADPETIYKRKQELSPEEIERQLNELRKLAKSHKRFILVDANRTPQELVVYALEVISNYQKIEN